MEVLRTMPSWSWEEYKKALARRGYSVYERKDKKDVLRGYAILKGNTKYKASELGVARNLMIPNFPEPGKSYTTGRDLPLRSIPLKSIDRNLFKDR